MIRFSAFLVVVAVGLLVAGVVTSKLLLVYIAIGVSGVALLALGVGAAVNWRELTGEPRTAAAETSAQGLAAQEPALAPQPQVPASQLQVPASQVVPALAASQPKPPATAVAEAAPAGSGWPAAQSAPSRTGHLPEQPPRSQPPWATFTARPQAPPPPLPPQPAGKPVPPRGEDAAEPSVEDRPPVKDLPLEKDQSLATGQTTEDQPSPEEQASAGRQADAEPAASAAPATAEAPATPSADQPEPADQPEQAAQADQPAQANQADQPEQDKPSTDPESGGPDPNLEVTVVPGVPRYHNAQCILIRFMGEKDLERMTLGAARQVGCTPCRACLPDQPDKAPE